MRELQSQGPFEIKIFFIERTLVPARSFPNSSDATGAEAPRFFPSSFPATE